MRPPYESAGSAHEAHSQGSFMHLLTSLLRDIPGLISDRVHLVALELRRARQAAVQMVALVVVAAILAATAWIALWGFVIAVALTSGLPSYAALILVLLLNLVGGWLAIKRAKALAGYLALPATVRRLTTKPAAKPVAPPPTHATPSGAPHA